MGALAVGFVAFMLTRRSIFAGVVAVKLPWLAGKCGSAECYRCVPTLR